MLDKMAEDDMKTTLKSFYCDDTCMSPSRRGGVIFSPILLSNTSTYILGRENCGYI